MPHLLKKSLLNNKKPFVLLLSGLLSATFATESSASNAITLNVKKRILLQCVEVNYVLKKCIDSKINTSPNNGCPLRLAIKVVGAANQKLGSGFVKYKSVKNYYDPSFVPKWALRPGNWAGFQEDLIDYIDADCFYSGKISVKKSTSYTVTVKRYAWNRDFEYEFLDWQLADRKWKVSISDENLGLDYGEECSLRGVPFTKGSYFCDR